MILPRIWKACPLSWKNNTGDNRSADIIKLKHRGSSRQDMRFATLQRRLFIYLIKKIFHYQIFA